MASPARRSKTATATRKAKDQSRDFTSATSPPSTLHPTSNRQSTRLSTHSTSKSQTSATSAHHMSPRPPNQATTTTVSSTSPDPKTLTPSSRRWTASRHHGARTAAARSESTRPASKPTDGSGTEHRVRDMGTDRKVGIRAGGQRDSETGEQLRRGRRLLSS